MPGPLQLTQSPLPHLDLQQTLGLLRHLMHVHLSQSFIKRLTATREARGYCLLTVWHTGLAVSVCHPLALSNCPLQKDERL